ncbi:MAG: GerMN domain-containing protein [Lachnospiraceae bacterium]|nr:GerMN domain-containing protein [Lachnospiraceae bacterium]
MKKMMILMSILLLIMVGCESRPITSTVPAGDTAQKEQVQTEQSQEEILQEEVAEPVNVVIYYSNIQADGFAMKEMQIESLTPENLIDELAKVNIVSIDTKVIGFSETEQSLTLDLSKDFEQYLSMMGSSGEYMVLGGIVNTFLDAYDAKDILITVEGNVLESGHATYDKPLEFHVMASADEETVSAEQKAPLKYRLKDEAYHHNDAEIYYPQFTEMTDGSIQDQWNAAIRQLTIGAAEDISGEYKSYTVDYTIVTCDTEFVSILFEKEVVLDGRVVKDMFALNFDLVECKNVRLSDWNKAIDTVAYNLANQGYYKILDDDVDRETYDEHMKMTVSDAEEYKTQFAGYDYDLADLETEPLGTSYVKDGILIIIMDVPDALGGTLQIETGVEVR